MSDLRVRPVAGQYGLAGIPRRDDIAALVRIRIYLPAYLE
jgi:hypothetical protein